MKTLVEIAQRIMDLRDEVEKFDKEYNLGQKYGYEHPSFPADAGIAEKQAELQELTQILSSQAFGHTPMYPMMLGSDTQEKGKYNALKWFLGNE